MQAPRAHLGGHLEGSLQRCSPPRQGRPGGLGFAHGGLRRTRVQDLLDARGHAAALGERPDLAAAPLPRAEQLGPS